MIVETRTIGDATLILGDSLEVLDGLEANAFDAVITDPPYSSGGQFRSDRMRKTGDKYINTDSVWTNRDEFSGDNRDQRGFLVWSTMWLGKLHQAATPFAPIMVFTDWRQLPTMTDALQCGGWVWRNVVTWWKRGVRMQRGRFSSSSEYIVYGSCGPLQDDGECSPQNVLEYPPVPGEEKSHMSEKPVELMKDLVSVTRPGARVIDPFMGSGTTGVACVQMGRPFIGIEIGRKNFETACQRIEDARRQAVFNVGVQAPLFQASAP